MKEEANRYFIIMFVENVKKTLTCKEEIDEFMAAYNKKNRDKKNQFVSGNLKTVHRSESIWMVTYSLYKKITIQKPLQFIDNFITERFENEDEIKAHYQKDVASGNGKLYIGYMYNGQVKTAPIFYKKDRIYTNYNELTQLMVENIESPAFLSKVWTNPKLNAPEYRQNIEAYLEAIQVAYGKYVMQKDGIDSVKDTVRNFMKAWCTSKGVINQQRVREVGSIVKNSLTPSKEIKEEKKIETELQAKSEEALARKLSISKNENDITLF